MPRLNQLLDLVREFSDSARKTMEAKSWFQALEHLVILLADGR